MDLLVWLSLRGPRMTRMDADDGRSVSMRCAKFEMLNGKTAQGAMREGPGFAVSDEISGNYAMYGEFPAVLRDSRGHLWCSYVASMVASRRQWNAKW